jgi:hypothetical protein
MPFWAYCQLIMLLTHDTFREKVFARDNHTCVLCGSAGEHAYHIIDQHLFTEPNELGGYFLDNGATVCGPCRIKCEQTVISVEVVREAAKITKKIVPSYLYKDDIIDRWGNFVLKNGNRLRGPLFYNKNVQNLLEQGGVLPYFTKYVKYERTYHLPWSPGVQCDDRVIHSLEAFKNKEVVVTEKMDGENTTIYNDYIHARSIDSKHHESRNWVKNFAANWQYQLADNMRVCGENLYAQHSIRYENLDSYFLGFSMWVDDFRLHWDEMLEYFELLGIVPVKVLYRGVFDEDLIKSLYSPDCWAHSEGYVVTTVEGFRLSDFKTHVAKYVRKGHVQPNKNHWSMQKIIPNGLKHG